MLLCFVIWKAVPLAVVEEILLNLPAHQVVQVCRLVCREWKELVDSAAHWRERCRTEGLQPYDASRPPEDWRLFYFLSKFRRNLLKNPRAEDGLQGWEIVQNGADRWVTERNRNEGDRWATERNRKLFPENTVTRCFVTYHSLCLKEQLIDLKKEGYSDAFMDQLRPRIKISDWYIPPSGYRSHYTLYVQFLDQEKNPIRTCHPYNYFRQQGSDYPWCQVSRITRTVQLFPCNQANSQSLTVPEFVLLYFRLPTFLGIMDLGFGLSVSLMEAWDGLEYGLLTVVWKSVQLQRGSVFQSDFFFFLRF
uniref:Si:dkey-147f3.8 n=1 Tax=Cyprinus carpio TaxID=7962 RepID=A0A8C1PZW6_CYPCA